MARLRTCLRKWRGKQEWTYHESVQSSFLKIGLRARQAFEKCISSLGAGAELGLGIPQKKQENLR